MPVHTGKDGKDCYAQWGSHGKKYYYTCGNVAARERAKKRAGKQGAAAHAHGYVSNMNRKGADNMKTFQAIVTNLKPVVRHDSMEGKDWLVVPTQMIVEGVHAGSDGPIFYPANELAKVTNVWNHKPVVVYHPTRNGVNNGSACNPTELTSRKVGVLLSTEFNSETKKLGAESWLEPDRISAVDSRVMESIDNNEMVEVSTGMFMNLEKTSGEWNGKKYVGIARDIQPDHLAILPDVKGACSIEDGAGLVRMNAAMINEMSYDSVQTLLRGKLRADKPEESDAWILDVFDAYFIYEEGGKLHRQNYNIKDGQVNFDGMPVLVEKRVTYEEASPLTNAVKSIKSSNVKGNDMDKKKIVDELVANERTSWSEEHRAMLMKLDDSVLTNMHADVTTLSEAVAVAEAEVRAKPKTGPEANSDGKNTDAGAGVPSSVANVQLSEAMSGLAEFISKAPDKYRSFLADGVATMNQKCEEFIGTILANSRNTFTRENLLQRDVQELKALAALAKEQDTTSDAVNNNVIPMYIGQGGAVDNSGSQVEPLLLPVMNFEVKTA